MATSSSKQLYPLSTEDNKAIPLDIIRPLAVIKKATGSALVDITIPADWSIASFYSAAGCFVQFGGATLVSPLIEGTPYADTLFVPPGCIVTSTVTPGVAKVLSMAGTSSVIIQQVQKWAGIALQRQLSTI